MLCRVLTVIVLMVFSHPVGANTLAREAQELLFRLGYEISVDGAWGPKSQRVLTEFYQDQNQSFDGLLDDTELYYLRQIVEGIDQTEYKFSLPQSANVNTICERNLNFDTMREPYTDSRLAQYVSVPQAITPSDILYETVMGLVYDWTAQILVNPSDQTTAEKLNLQLQALFDWGVGSVISQSRIVSDGNNETALLSQTDYLLTLSYAILALKETNNLGSEDLDYLTQSLSNLVYSPDFSQNFYFTAAGCSRVDIGYGASRPFRCQNHTYGKQHLRAIMGVLLSDDEELRAAVNFYRFAIDDLGSDGALWREAIRGAYSWTYYSHALGHLVGIADIVSRRWFDLWAYENSAGNSIHSAVDFYSASLADPLNEELMLRYAQRNQGVDRGRRGDFRNLDGHSAVLVQTRYSEWLPVYYSNFPQSQSAANIYTLIRTDYPPGTSNHYGLNTWCVYQVPE